jgi:hypothetical protein
VILAERDYRFGRFGRFGDDDGGDSDFTPTDAQTTNLLNLDNSSQDNFTPTQQQEDNLLGVQSQLSVSTPGAVGPLTYATQTDSGAGSSATDNILGGETYSLGTSSSSSVSSGLNSALTGVGSVLKSLFGTGTASTVTPASILGGTTGMLVLGGVGVLLVVALMKNREET